MFKSEIPIMEQIVFKEEKFPLIDLWIEQVARAYSIRTRIIANLDQQEFKRLEQFGFPAGIIPVMSLWRSKGPDILTSFSHPEELDLYKYVGLFNLRLLQEKAKLEGINFQTTLVNYYDTVPIKNSIITPLRVANLGSKANIFGITNSDISSLSPISRFNLKEGYFLFEISEIAKNIMGQLETNVINQIKKQQGSFKGKATILRMVEEGIKSRLRVILNIFSSVYSPNSRQTTIGEFFTDFEKELGAFIFNPLSQPIENQFGYSCYPLSQNTAFLDLVRESLSILIETYGLNLIKRMIQPSQGLVILPGSDKTQILTIDKQEEFSILDKFQQSRKSSDEEAIKLIFNGIPLAKLESLALVAGGFTLHMGSEYNVREKIIETLGISDGAKEYLMNLRIGQDKEHGNSVITIKGMSNDIPLLLLYLLFGRERIKKMTLNVVGTRNQPIQLDIKEMKSFATQALVEDVLNPESDINYFNQERKYGIYN